MGNKLYRWLVGFVIIHLRGKYGERFINAAVRKGLEIWEIKRLENDRFQMGVRLRDFFRLRPLLKETSTRLRIIKKVGFPFRLQKLWKRKGILLGLFIFILFMYMLSTLVWKIEVTGEGQFSKLEVLEVAEEIGLKRGALKWRLGSVEDIQSALLKKVDEAAWIGVRIDGVVVRIEVVGKVLPEARPNANPRHLVASKKAIVHHYVVEKGLPRVRPNQLVNEGDILVSGIIGSDGAPERQKVVSATGQVWGEVWYESTISLPLKQNMKGLSGEMKSKNSLIIGNYRLKMWGRGSKEEFEDAKVEEDRHFLYFRERQLPIGWEKSTSWELIPEERNFTAEEIVPIGLKLAREDLLKKTGPESEIKIEKVLQQWEENDKVYIKIYYAIIEEISKERLIIGHEPSS